MFADYQIVEEQRFESLVAGVKERTLAGWIPVGALQNWLGGAGESAWRQAMVQHISGQQVVEYELLEVLYWNDLESSIRSMVRQGWIPVAAPYMYLTTSGGQTYYQTMVRYLSPDAYRGAAPLL